MYRDQSGWDQTTRPPHSPTRVIHLYSPLRPRRAHIRVWLEERRTSCAGMPASRNDVKQLLKKLYDEPLGADGVQDDTRVETKTVEGDIEGEPRIGRSEEDLSVLPLREVGNEVATSCLGCLDALDRGVRVNVVTTVRQEFSTSWTACFTLRSTSMVKRGVSGMVRRK